MPQNHNRLSDNIFAKQGWERLDGIAVNCLKRGRNGEGYDVSVDFESGAPGFELTGDQRDLIGKAIDISGSSLDIEPETAIQGITSVIAQAYKDARSEQSA